MKTKALVFNLMLVVLLGYLSPVQASDGRGLSVELNSDREFKQLIEQELQNEVNQAEEQHEEGAGLFDDEPSNHNELHNQQEINEPSKPVEQAAPSCNLVALLKDYSKQQCAAVAAGAVVLGYGIYKGYQWVLSCYVTDAIAEQPIQLTAKESEILINFADAMAQDVKQARSGNRRPSIVKGFDISGLSMPLVIECNAIQNDFVKLYNECDEQGNNVDLLNMFYCQVNDAVKALLACAEII